MRIDQLARSQNRPMEHDDRTETSSLLPRQAMRAGPSFSRPPIVLHPPPPPPPKSRTTSTHDGTTFPFHVPLQGVNGVGNGASTILSRTLVVEKDLLLSKQDNLDK